MKIYSLFSKSLNRYNLPFFAEDDQTAIASVSKMVTAQQDPSLICALDDLQLRTVGTFNMNADAEGDPIWFDSFGSGLLMDDLHKNLPLPPTVKERIDKYYGGAQNG